VGDVVSRREASDAVSGLGWRYLLGGVGTRVAVASLARAAEVASHVVAVCGPAGEASLGMDLRRDQVVLTLRSREAPRVTRREIELAGRISAAVRDLGLATDAGGPHSVQAMEIAIDALDIPVVRPFWQAVTDYSDHPWETGPEASLVDPSGQGPAIWFQQMDAPRTQRNRIHVDITVPHDEAAHRIKAALDAGGRLAYDAEAPAFWVLADPEGNEACVCTWQARD
jgi:4a-hydroxytetrahydrobiopterin dehydratase